jgi:hypothetical protein
LDQISKLHSTTERQIQRQESNIGDFRRVKISPGK